MSLKYIITGTGRCGTMFMSKFLTSAKIHCEHEFIFTNLGIDIARENLKNYPDIVAEASYMAAPYLSTDILKDCKIIHLVREPIQVINSFVVGYCYFFSHRLNCDQIEGEWTYEYPPGADPEFKFMNFIYSHVPELKRLDLSAVDRAALYYINWNKMIEKQCKGRDFLLFPIENDISILCKYLNIKKTNLYNDKNTNKSEYKRKYSIHSLSSKEIQKDLIEIGRKYGYSMKTPMML